MDIQYGLPTMEISEDRIAKSSYLGCECGLSHFIPCFRREACLGLRKPIPERYTPGMGFSALIDMVKDVFPGAWLVKAAADPDRSEARTGRRRRAVPL